MITIPRLIVAMPRGGGAMWPFNENMNIHFDNDWDTYMTPKIYDESGYGLRLVRKKWGSMGHSKVVANNSL